MNFIREYVKNLTHTRVSVSYRSLLSLPPPFIHNYHTVQIWSDSFCSLRGTRSVIHPVNVILRLPGAPPVT